MICYRDMTFCSFYTNCAVGSTCSRALTPEVVKKANLWWGRPEAPISQFVDQPHCHQPAEGVP